MKRMSLRKVSLSLIPVFGLVLLVPSLQARPKLSPKQQQAVTEAVGTLTSFSTLREGLASTLEGQEEVTIEDFRRVCAPIGQQVRAWAEEKGYQAKQVSTRYRNPNNKASEEEARELAWLKANPNLKMQARPGQIKVNEEMISGVHLYVPIRVASSCLHCHGAQDSRPEFVRQNYPEDKAHGFKTGDLRGMYSVFIKD